MAKQMIYESKWGEETVELTMSQYADNKSEAKRS